MHTILGAGGAIGTELAKALRQYTNHIRLASRNPQRVNETDELWPADLTQAAAVAKAVAGSEVVYLVAGLPYKAKVWEAQWPQIMKNVVEACIQQNCKLVFFDNIYMYDPKHLAHLTEATPVSPVSRKGKVRAAIAQMLLDAAAAGQLQGMIVRAADFIGTKNSVLTEMVIKKLARGKKATWMCAADKIHSFTYVPDAAKATALLGNTPEAFNQVWHLPTDPAPLTGKQWIMICAGVLQAKPACSVLSTTAMGLLGLFVPVLREFKEMAYQYQQDYFFDSSKFTNQFGIKATPAADAVRQTAVRLLKH